MHVYRQVLNHTRAGERPKLFLRHITQARYPLSTRHNPGESIKLAKDTSIPGVHSRQQSHLGYVVATETFDRSAWPSNTTTASSRIEYNMHVWSAKFRSCSDECLDNADDIRQICTRGLARFQMMSSCFFQTTPRLLSLFYLPVHDFKEFHFVKIKSKTGETTV